MVEEIIIFGIRLVFALYCVAILILFSSKAIELRKYLEIKDWLGALTLILLAIGLIYNAFYYDPEHFYEPANTVMALATLCLIVYSIMLLITLIKTKSKLKGYVPIIMITIV